MRAVPITRQTATAAQALPGIARQHMPRGATRPLVRMAPTKEDRDAEADLLDGGVAGWLHRRARRGDRLVGADEELHRFHNRQMREIGAHLCGRRLYEEMVYWETADQNPSAEEHELEFARIWKSTPKIVFSKYPRQRRG